MSFNRLIAYIDRALVTDRSIVIETARFESLTGHTMTRERANEAAWTIVNQRKFVASAEAFLHAETHEIIRVYLICARSRTAYTERVQDLQRGFVAELGGEITEKAIYEHLHNDPVEAAGPTPLKTPAKRLRTVGGGGGN